MLRTSSPPGQSSERSKTEEESQGIAPGFLDVSNDDHVLEVDGQNHGYALTFPTWEIRISSSFIH